MPSKRLERDLMYKFLIIIILVCAEIGATQSVTANNHNQIDNVNKDKKILLEKKKLKKLEEILLKKFKNQSIQKSLRDESIADTIQEITNLNIKINIYQMLVKRLHR